MKKKKRNNKGLYLNFDCANPFSVSETAEFVVTNDPKEERLVITGKPRQVLDNEGNECLAYPVENFIDYIEKEIRRQGIQSPQLPKQIGENLFELGNGMITNEKGLCEFNRTVMQQFDESITGKCSATL